MQYFMYDLTLPFFVSTRQRAKKKLVKVCCDSQRITKKTVTVDMCLRKKEERKGEKEEEKKTTGRQDSRIK